MFVFRQFVVALLHALLLSSFCLTGGKKTCQDGNFYHEGFDICRSCTLICNSLENSLQEECFRTETCRAYWPTSAPPTVPLTTLSAPSVTDIILSYSTEGDSSSYTWLAGPWSGSLLVVFIAGLALMYVIKSRRGGSDTRSTIDSVTGSTIDSQELHSLTKDDNSQTVEIPIGTNEVHNCKSFNQIKPESGDHGCFATL